MLPLVFLPDTPVLLAGRGPAYGRRLSLLRGAGMTDLALHEGGLPDAGLLEGKRLVFGAGLDASESEALAGMARARAIPVNIEDVPPLCDLHVPALVRRGDLLLTVSTAGTAPVLSSALRGWLEHAFGEEWASRMAEVATLRAQLRASGSTPSEVSRAVRDHLADSGWLTPP